MAISPVHVIIHAPLTTVWEALTSPSIMKLWAGDNCTVTISGKGDYRFSGTSVYEGGGNQKDASFREHQEISFVWPLHGEDTSVTLTLSETDGSTRVEALHEAEGMTAHRRHEIWRYLLSQLKHVVEYGPVPFRFDFSRGSSADLHFRLSLPFSPANVFRALSTKEMLDKWFTYDGVVDARQGGSIDYGWGYDPVPITEFVPGRRLVTPWLDGTVVAWTVEGNAGATEVKLDHTGFTDAEAAEDTWIGWGILLTYMIVILQNNQPTADWVGPLS